MKISIKKFIVPSIPLAVVLIGSCLLLWLLSYISQDANRFSPTNTSDYVPIDQFLKSNLYISGIISVVLTLFNAFLLEQLSTKFSLIRVRSFLPILIYILLISTWSLTGISIINHFCATLFILSLFVFLSVYRDQIAVEQAFTVSLLLGVCSFFSLALILLIAAFWIGLILFQSMSLRTFLASVFGVVVPWILYVSIRMYLHPDTLIINDILNHFNVSFTFIMPSGLNIAYILLMVIILIIAIVSLFNNLQNDSIKTRQRLKFFVYTMLISIIIAFIFTTYTKALLPIIALNFAILISHPFSLQKSNFNSIIFYLFFVVNILYVALQYLSSI